MYLAGVSVRRVEDITEALWGTRVSPSTVSELNKKIYATIDGWRNRPIEGEHPYAYLDGIVLKRSWAGEVRNRRNQRGLPGNSRHARGRLCQRRAMRPSDRTRAAPPFRLPIGRDRHR
jgi:hypothetical protein